MISLIDVGIDIIELNGNKYHIEYLTSGGFSIIYKALSEDTLFNKYVIIKELYPHGYVIGRDDKGALNVSNKEYMSHLIHRGKRESHIANMLVRSDDRNNNPWFLSYSEPIYCEQTRTYYTIIETESGEILSSIIEKNKIQNFSDACEYILSILTALEQIHAKKYLHLDISPNNIYISSLGIARIIDYNSALEENTIVDNSNISYNTIYSAPEIINLHKKKIGQAQFSKATDIYSVTAIFFEMLTKRVLTSRDRRKLGSGFFEGHEEIIVGKSNLLVRKVNDLLRKGLYKIPDNRIVDIEEMRGKILELIEIDQKYELINNRKRPYEHFIGRKKYLIDIEDSLKNDTYVILEGIGGIGKSELAKQYSWIHREDYNIIQFINYEEDLLTTIAKHLKIANFNESLYWDDYPKERVMRRIFEDKMNLLKGCDENTLIIIDNYDVDIDDDFERFVSSDYKVIFTTREKHNGNVIEVQSMDRDTELFPLFYSYYGKSHKSPEDERNISKIMDLVLDHTMTIILIAKSMIEHDINSYEMLKRLNESLDPDLRKRIILQKEEIPVSQCRQIIYQHILNLFDIGIISNNISEHEVCIFLMTNMAIIPHKGMPYRGISKTDFCHWVLNKRYEYNKVEYTTAYYAAIDKLIKLRWIEYDGENISLHPIISEVINTRLNPDSKKCSALINGFLEQYSEKIFTFVENMQYIDMVSLAVKRIVDSTELTSGLYASIAAAYFELAHYKYALEYANKARSILQELKNLDYLLQVNQMIVSIFLELDKLSQAKELNRSLINQLDENKTGR